MLRVVRLKGRVGLPAIADAAGLAQDGVAAVVQELVSAGHLTEANGRFRLTPEGRERLTVLLDEERAELDTAAIAALYEDRAEGAGRRVADARRRAQRSQRPRLRPGILDRLAALHRRTEDLLERMIAVAPRLASYPRRFEAALGRIQAGNHSWFLRPIVDSYHTVWFELHEDLDRARGPDPPGKKKPPGERSSRCPSSRWMQPST